MTEQFKTTAEYRHWMARHNWDEHVRLADLLETAGELLPEQERDCWQLVCKRYSARDFPQWFIKEVGELHDY